MFCVLSQNQHFLKNNICIVLQTVKGTENGIEILVDYSVKESTTGVTPKRNHT